MTVAQVSPVLLHHQKPLLRPFLATPKFDIMRVKIYTQPHLKRGLVIGPQYCWVSLNFPIQAKFGSVVKNS